MEWFRYRAIVFDFDGVLVECADIKTHAYGELYQAHGPDAVEQVMAFDRQHAGMSRFEKFKHYHERLLGKTLGPAEEKDLLDRFSRLVEDRVACAPWVPGAKQFLDQTCQPLSLYIASGTPEDELLRIVSRRQMEHYFKGVYGSPKKKDEILVAIRSISGLKREEVVMIGDSITDHEGAKKAGIDFIAREDGRATFPRGTPRIRDFLDHTFLQEALCLASGKTI